MLCLSGLQNWVLCLLQWQVMTLGATASRDDCTAQDVTSDIPRLSETRSSYTWLLVAASQVAADWIWNWVCWHHLLSCSVLAAEPGKSGTYRINPSTVGLILCDSPLPHWATPSAYRGIWAYSLLPCVGLCQYHWSIFGCTWVFLVVFLWNWPSIVSGRNTLRSVAKWWDRPCWDISPYLCDHFCVALVMVRYIRQSSVGTTAFNCYLHLWWCLNLHVLSLRVQHCVSSARLGLLCTMVPCLATPLLFTYSSVQEICMDLYL